MDIPQTPAYRPVDQADPGRSNPAANVAQLTSQKQPRLSTTTDRPRGSYPLPNHQALPRRKPVPTSHVWLLSSSSTSKEHNAPEKPQQPSGWWSITLALLEEWSVWEAIGLLGSALALLAIVVILDKHNFKRQPSWRQVSLNTIISWLSTLSKLLVFIPLSTGMGQLKWIWIADRKRELADLGVFDSASRGALGSIGLLWTTKGWHVAGLGALATILAVAFDPFNQNLIHYYQANIEDKNQLAYLANASSYDNIGPMVGGSVANVDPILKANVYNSIFNPNAYQSWGIPEYVCGSGNCTWDPITSLEARAFCSNITSHMQKNCGWSPIHGAEMCNLTIPNGASTWYIIGSEENWGAQAMVLAQPAEPLIYTNISLDPPHRAPSILLTQWIMALGLDPTLGGPMTQAISNDTRWIATECSLELYVRSVNASVQNSIYQETTLATWSEIIYNQTAIPGSKDGIYFSFVLPKNSSLGMKNENEFFIGYEGYSSMHYGLLSSFNGTVMGISDNLAFGKYGTISSDILQALFVQNFTNCATPDDKLSCAMANVASAISKTFRDSALTNARAAGFNVSASDVQNRANMTVGRTLVSATFVKVHWQWLSLPALVWILTATTWIGTTVLTRRAKLQKWQNDILPLLFLYREDRVVASAGTDDAEESYAHGVSSKAFTLRAQSLQAKLFIKQNDAKLI